MIAFSGSSWLTNAAMDIGVSALSCESKVLAVNHKRVARLMREDNLLAVQPSLFMRTTDSKHEHPVALNLASRMRVNGVNQLWVADIT